MLRSDMEVSKNVSFSDGGENSEWLRVCVEVTAKCLYT